MNNVKRVFGSGIWGLSISIGLLIFAVLINKTFPIFRIFVDGLFLRVLVFGIFSAVCITLVILSLKTLRVKARGKELITHGVFRYFRHPLYAAFLTFFDFGIAIFSNSWVFVIWAIILHPIWHLLVHSEEKMMIDLFGNEYIEYCQKTGRFFPRVISSPKDG